MLGEKGLVTGIRAITRREATSMASTSAVRELSTNATRPSGLKATIDTPSVVSIRSTSCKRAVSITET
jgi:hypothetical protein